MATELILRKLHSTFVPVDEATLDAMESIRPNAEVKAVITQPRNIAFHRKLFALLKVAFDAWEAPELEYKGQKVVKNFDNFRRDLTILAGFYETYVNVKGEVRLAAKSLSFAKMDETEFEQLYNRFIDVILQKILTHYTRDDLEQVVEKVLRFA